MHTGRIAVGRRQSQSRQGLSGGFGGGASGSRPFIAATNAANRAIRSPESRPVSRREMALWWIPVARCRSRCDQWSAMRRRLTIAPRISQPRWTSGFQRSRSDADQTIRQP